MLLEVFPVVEVVGVLLDVEEINLKLECGARRNHVAYALLSVGHGGRDDQLPRLSDAHTDDTVIPPLESKIWSWKVTCYSEFSSFVVKESSEFDRLFAVLVNFGINQLEMQL